MCLLTSYSFHQMEDSSETSNQPENGEKIQAINEENIAKAAASALAAAAVKAKVTIEPTRENETTFGLRACLFEIGMFYKSLNESSLPTN